MALFEGRVLSWYFKITEKKSPDTFTNPDKFIQKERAESAALQVKRGIFQRTLKSGSRFWELK